MILPNPSNEQLVRRVQQLEERLQQAEESLSNADQMYRQLSGRVDKVALDAQAHAETFRFNGQKFAQLTDAVNGIGRRVSDLEAEGRR